MRTLSFFGLARTLVVLVAAIAPGCGSPGELTLTCDPACPAGFRCTQDGCASESGGGAPDLSVSVVDLGITCPSSCGGATPHCNAVGVCVPCLENSHCPAGTYCRVVGNTAACVPGCDEDARCSGPGQGMKCCANQCIDTSKDANNCGACGTSCMTPNAGSACVNGQCTAGACRAGWGDCNQNPADGCETNLRTDMKNCSACGMTCAIPNSLAACANGCYLAACSYGYEDCNSDAKDGCEVGTLADVKNCGGCGMLCAGVSRAQVGCNVGACIILSCSNGYSNCDGVYNNGCEVATGTDTRNCGQCGKQCLQGQVCINGECTCPPCNFPNAKAGCFGNLCGIASCNPGWANCDNNTNNGCEQNVDSDANNCGGCGMKCAQGLVCVTQSCTCPQCKIPNAKSVCVNNVCVLDSCLPGFFNCDGDPLNGCEANLNSDAKNCGRCGMACGGGESCIAGNCLQQRNSINGDYAAFIAAGKAFGRPNVLVAGDTVTETNTWGGFYFELSAGVTKARVTITGAGGSAATSAGGTGATGTVDSAPVFLAGQGKTGFWIILGQAGRPSAGGAGGTIGYRAFNGGGAATDWSNGQGSYMYAGGGGGGSDLRWTFDGSTSAPQMGGDPTLSFASRFAVVAGGGGGTKNGNSLGGFGGGFNTNGGDGTGGAGFGFGATGMAGGAIGGALGLGGDGKQDGSEGWAGGGGGGYYGGGASIAHYGGGGGSGYLMNAMGLTQVSTADGKQGGNALTTVNGAFTIVVN